MIRGGSRTAATSKMERFVIIVNDWKPLTIITKRSILDVAAALDPPLMIAYTMHISKNKTFIMKILSIFSSGILASFNFLEYEK